MAVTGCIRSVYIPAWCNLFAYWLTMHVKILRIQSALCHHLISWYCTTDTTMLLISLQCISHHTTDMFFLTIYLLASTVEFESLNQSLAPLATWVMGTWYTQSGMGTYEQRGHTQYQVMSNTWYWV